MTMILWMLIMLIRRDCINHLVDNDDCFGEMTLRIMAITLITRSIIRIMTFRMMTFRLTVGMQTLLGRMMVKMFNQLTMIMKIMMTMIMMLVIRLTKSMLTMVFRTMITTNLSQVMTTWMKIKRSSMTF